MEATLILPPAAAIAAAVAEFGQDANTKRSIALNKAQYDLAMGLAIVPVAGGFLVPSATRSGIIHRVETVAGCSCEAGRNGRDCRHKLAIEIVEQAQRYTMPALAKRVVNREQAIAEMDELY